MEAPIWTPRVTVAAIIEQAADPISGAPARFLLVEEHTDQGLRLNQPAGHLEGGETLLQAVVRETLEETARDFVPQALVGVYMTHVGAAAPAGATYLRFSYCGQIGAVRPERTLDPDIVRTLWLTLDELEASRARHRTPLVMRCIEDYLAGRRYPLDVVRTEASVGASGL